MEVNADAAVETAQLDAPVPQTLPEPVAGVKPRRKPATRKTTTRRKTARGKTARKTTAQKTAVQKPAARKNVRRKATTALRKATPKRARKTVEANDPEKTGGQAVRKRRTVSPASGLYETVEAQVCNVLMELMCASESDAVRVSAAKALIDQAKRNGQTEDGEDEKQGRQERACAIAEIRRIMGELADAKSCSGAGPDEMDQDGACQPADPEG